MQWPSSWASTADSWCTGMPFSAQMPPMTTVDPAAVPSALCCIGVALCICCCLRRRRIQGFYATVTLDDAAKAKDRAASRRAYNEPLARGAELASSRTAPSHDRAPIQQTTRL